MFDGHRDRPGEMGPGLRPDGGDLPDDVTPPGSIRKAEPRLDAQLREEIRSRSRQGKEEETAMMLERESEWTVTQAVK